MKSVEDIETIRQEYSKCESDSHKKTLILALDECILKTSIFKDEFPRVDGFFRHQKLKIYTCFRKDLNIFLKEA